MKVEIIKCEKGFAEKIRRRLTIESDVKALNFIARFNKKTFANTGSIVPRIYYYAQLK